MHSSKKLKSYKLQARQGFSLIEIILVVGIMAIISVFGSLNYFSLRNSKALENMVSRVSSDIIYAAERSKTQESGLQWWINFQNTADTDYYLICSGALYSGSGANSDCGAGAVSGRVQVTTGLSISFSSGGSALDLIFEKGTGLPVNSSGGQIAAAITVTVSSNAGIASKNITIDKNGRVDY